MVKAGGVRRHAESPLLCSPPGSHHGALRKREEQLTRLNAATVASVFRKICKNKQLSKGCKQFTIEAETALQPSPNMEYFTLHKNCTCHNKQL